MEKESRIIKIDTSVWINQVEKAKNYPRQDGGVGVPTSWISRLIREGKIDSWYIPELKIRLAKR